MNLNSLAFGLGTVAVFVAHWQARRLFRRQDAIVQKYKLYRVRDRLICLVASHDISEEDFVFRYFYEAVTFVIKRTDTLNLH